MFNGKMITFCAIWGTAKQTLESFFEMEEGVTVHLYLSLFPEALIASMLSPEEFGAYYALGTQKKSRGQAIFFEVDPAYRHPFFRIDEGVQRCVPHEDGTPKSSIYIGVYRVLEHMTLDALQHIYLVTQDGRTLELSPSANLPKKDDELHLYQEIIPVTPLVASRLDPVSFFDLIVNNPNSLVTVPAICFSELRLGDLATDPEMGLVNDLPYSNIDHLRECLVELKTKYVSTKMIDRVSSSTFPYRTVKNGIFVGIGENLRYYPLPSQEDLRENHYRWWRSANM